MSSERPSDGDTAGFSGSPAAGASAQAGGGRRGSVFGRHKWLTVLGVLVLVLVAGCSAFALYLNNALNNVSRVPLDQKVLPAASRPARVAQAGQAMNILIAGTDNGNSGQSVSQAVASGHWTPGEFRSDTMMIVHIDADRQHVYVVSIPRDSWVHIDGIGMSKINAAFSYGGPSLMVKTVEQLTNLRIDHLAMIDWAGFKDLTTALGGVRVYIPKTFYDTSQKRQWTKGWHVLEGKDALQYVRTRYNLPSNNGDFGRINRQQNFLRQVFHQTLSSGTLTNPVKLTGVLQAITSNLTVDEGFTSSDIRSLALQLRNLRSGDVTFMTAPLARNPYGTSPDGESIVLLNKRRCAQLWDAMRVDKVQSYLKRHPGSLLPGKKQVD
jgi:LCP family protein required for cell wall assembly